MTAALVVLTGMVAGVVLAAALFEAAVEFEIRLVHF